MSTFVTNTSHKSRKTALLLCIFGGLFWVHGLHYFYVGRYGRGLLYMCTIGFVGIGWIIDIWKILVGDFKDRQGNPLIEW